MISQIESDLTLLRELVARELDTINAYRRLAAECDDPTTVEFFMHVAAEEKFHIADALRAIALLDTDQADLLQRGFAAGHGPGDVPAHTAGFALKAWDSIDLACRDDAYSASLGPDSADRGGTVSDRASSRESARVANLWTVGSLRRVPQNE